MGERTVRIGDVFFVVSKVDSPDGEEVRCMVRDGLKVGAVVVSVQMTKAQSSTLGDVFKALAL